MFVQAFKQNLPTTHSGKRHPQDPQAHFWSAFIADYGGAYFGSAFVDDYGGRGPCLFRLLNKICQQHNPANGLRKILKRRRKTSNQPTPPQDPQAPAASTPPTPTPNSAKSYLTGSEGSRILRLHVSSSTAFQSF